MEDEEQRNFLSSSVVVVVVVYACMNYKVSCYKFYYWKTSHPEAKLYDDRWCEKARKGAY